jgi:hypothetical protein
VKVPFHKSEHCPGCSSAPTRRKALQLASNGFGLLAFAALEGQRALADSVRRPTVHFPPKAKNIIFLFMPGGVSHMESFDPKPKLADMDGKLSSLIRRGPLRSRILAHLDTNNATL